MSQNIALITGASSGIGTELARHHAQQGGDLVLVARSESTLNRLKEEFERDYGIKVWVLTEDLSQPGSAQRVFEATEALGIEVELLINNAGFGGHGRFHQRDLGEDEAMMQLNMATLTSLTHCYLQVMVQRGHGKVLNVASTAAFMPGPLQAVYYATKSFVLSFSQAVAKELEGSGVTVTALCPGAVDTGFVRRGNLEGVEIFDKAATPESVALCGYDAMMKGELVAINERQLSFMLNWVVPLLPRKWVLALSQRAMEKTA
ncbi:SDR family oxidoreductase [Ferrimonas sp. YFM]|uniref:SDR family NAD(P)-dependent oxidoreductase n=1 Tax=Ferrimonas sp. YFM TaxID=3028878 RepID=UPI002573E80F|nr:SDR family oxidoreductase [Ferrimonas sp. YFM]BDY05361.1 short-chain dehydrogenase [Ferrimonas sp. YFM]